MGGVCSRKQDSQGDSDNVQRGLSGRYCKSGSSKWLSTSLHRSLTGTKQGLGKRPSLMELCIHKACDVSISLQSFCEDLELRD